MYVHVHNKVYHFVKITCNAIYVFIYKYFISIYSHTWQMHILQYIEKYKHRFTIYGNLLCNISHYILEDIPI